MQLKKHFFKQINFFYFLTLPALSALPQATITTFNNHNAILRKLKEYNFKHNS